MAVRPYFMTFRGVPHIVEAANAALAVQHVVGADVTELRPARAAEVAAWARAGKEIPTASGKSGSVPSAIQGGGTLATIVSTPGVEAAVDDVEDACLPVASPSAAARLWLCEQPVAVDEEFEVALAAFDAAKVADRLTLAQFDTIRTVIPTFAEAIGEYRVGANEAWSVETTRSSLEDLPMAFEDVVVAIARRRLDENLYE